MWALAQCSSSAITLKAGSCSVRIISVAWNESVSTQPRGSMSTKLSSRRPTHRKRLLYRSGNGME